MTEELKAVNTVQSALNGAIKDVVSLYSIEQDEKKEQLQVAILNAIAPFNPDSATKLRMASQAKAVASNIAIAAYNPKGHKLSEIQL